KPAYLTNVDVLTYAGNLANLDGVAEEHGDRYEFFKADIANADQMDELMTEHQFYAIINFAAESHVDRSINSPQNFIHTNVIGTKAMRDEPLPVYGDGMNVRDWIHVQDHCAAVVAALFEGKPGAIYNFGGNSEMVNLDVAKRILKRLAKPESLISFVEDRLGHDRRYAIDSAFVQS